MGEQAMSERYVGFDLDGTLACYDCWRGEDHIGDPIPAMCEKYRQWREAGFECRIITARAHGNDRPQIELIQDWAEKHLGERPPVQDFKSYGLICLYDDRAIRVEPNTGRIIGGDFKCTEHDMGMRQWILGQPQLFQCWHCGYQEHREVRRHVPTVTCDPEDINDG